MTPTLAWGRRSRILPDERGEEWVTIARGTLRQLPAEIVGFRPTPGRVPNWPASNAWETLSVLGPLAGRTVEDAAFLFAAMAGPDPRVPTAISEPGAGFGGSLKRDFRRVRVAWSPDLGGLPVDDRVRAVLESRRRVFRDLGCIVEEASPDFSGATEAFETLRALSFLQKNGALYADPKRRAQLKQTVVWNIEEGLRRLLFSPKHR